MSVNIATFSWRNIWRNRRRTIFTLISLIFGVTCIIFLQSYLEGFRKTSADELINTQIGHIKIAQSEFLRLERILPREYPINETDLNHLQKTLSTIPGIKMTGERVKFHALVSHEDENETVVIIGMDPQKADQSMELSQAIIQGNYYSNPGDNHALNLIIGKSLAGKLNVSVGDELLIVTSDINYSTYALPFKIAGIFETGYSSMDKHIIFIPLDKAQEMLNYGKSVSELLVFLNDPDQAIQVAGTIKQSLASTSTPIDSIPWQKSDYVAGFMPMVNEIIDKIVFILMLMVALVILNTMLMGVMERYQEIGVIKALGLKNGEVRKMVLFEAMFIGIIGSTIGGILGSIISATLEKTGINISQMLGESVLDKMDLPVPLLGKMLYPDFSFTIFISTFLFGVITAVIAALYPAIKSAKMSPVEAFHSQLNV